MTGHPAYNRNPAEARAITERAKLDPEGVGQEVSGLRENLFNAEARNAVLEGNIKRLEASVRRLEQELRDERVAQLCGEEREQAGE